MQRTVLTDTALRYCSRRFTRSSVYLLNPTLTDMQLYLCPLCSLPLHQESKSLVCENKHCFDIAKEGYVNLLPVQDKKSRSPGDDADMIAARRRFLDKGFYQRLVNVLKDYIASCSTSHVAAQHEQLKLLDIGCGEGYYVNQLKQAVPELDIYALDISKPAIRSAAKKYKDIFFNVGSAYNLLFPKEQFDYALSIFSPINLDEALRVLKQNSLLIKVGPGPGHLNELAAIIYEHAEPHKGNNDLNYPNELIKIDTLNVNERLILEGNDVFDLLHMTPYYWKSTKDQQKRIKELESTAFTLDFEIQIFKKQ